MSAFIEMDIKTMLEVASPVGTHKDKVFIAGVQWARLVKVERSEVKNKA